jgi:hypothetical protein
MNVLAKSPLQAHTHIFVHFPGIKWQGPQPQLQKKGGRIALHIKLNENRKLIGFALESENTLKLVKRKAKQSEEVVVDQLIGASQSVEGFEKIVDFEYCITEELSVIQKKVGEEIHFMFVVKEKEEVARKRKAKKRKPEKYKVTEYLLFAITLAIQEMEQEEKENIKKPSFKENVLLSEKAQRRSTGLKNSWFDEKIKSLFIKKFEASVRKSLVCLRFLGPGDHAYPLPRAEPLN